MPGHGTHGKKKMHLTKQLSDPSIRGARQNNLRKKENYQNNFIVLNHFAL